MGWDLQGNLYSFMIALSTKERSKCFNISPLLTQYDRNIEFNPKKSISKIKLVPIGCFLHWLSYSRIPTEAEPQVIEIRLKLFHATWEHAAYDCCRAGILYLRELFLWIFGGQHCVFSLPKTLLTTLQSSQHPNPCHRDTLPFWQQGLQQLQAGNYFFSPPKLGESNHFVFHVGIKSKLLLNRFSVGSRLESGSDSRDESSAGSVTDPMFGWSTLLRFSSEISHL